MALPRFAALQSSYTNKYMNYIQDDGKFHGYILFDGESVLSPFAKVEFVKSKSVKDCFHIRCCYNNKYWIRKADGQGVPVVGEAHEPEDDCQDNSKCTLFKVELLNGNPAKISLRHQSKGDPIWVNKQEGGYLSAGEPPSKIGEQTIHFKVIDLDSLFVLPKNVAFAGDNGSYLRARLINDKPYLEFSSDDPKEIASQHEVHRSPNGNVRILSKSFRKFWRRGPGDWIMPDSPDDKSTDQPPEDFGDTLFTPHMITANMVALVNVGNRLFCCRDTASSCLWAKCQSISKEATLEVIDLALSRKICDVDYHLRHARIYGGRVLVLGTLTATNSSSVATTESLKFSYTNTTTRTWSTNVSSKLGVKTTFKGGIPCLLGEKIIVSDGINANFEWGKTTQVSEQVEHVHQVAVPPKTRVIARLTATQGGCDVPFSYTQCDTIFDGSVIIHNMNDGLFSGTNTHNIKVETKEEPLN